MKKLLLAVLGVISYFCSAASGVWAVVEFILYLVKDKEFNWWSIWMILICGFTAILLFVLTAFYDIKDKNTAAKLAPKKPTFAERLAATAAARKQQPNDL